MYVRAPKFHLAYGCYHDNGKVSGSWRREVAYHAVKQPQLSVVLAVHDSQRHLVRALESVLSQEGCMLELVAVACDPSPAVASTLERYRDRDIRVEVVSCASARIDEGLLAGIRAARGTYLMLLRADDWLAPHACAQMLASACDGEAELIVPTRIVESARHADESRARRISAPSDVWNDTRSFRAAAPQLMYDGTLLELWGVAFRRELAPVSKFVLENDPWAASVLFEMMGGAACVAASSEALVHSAPDVLDAEGPFDPACYSCVALRYHAMCDLLSSWGLPVSSPAKELVHARYVLDVIACIDNASLGAGDASAAERIGCVQDMLEREETVAALKAVQAKSREFGIMYKPMSKKNAAGCCMGSRIRSLARISHIPVLPVL